MIELLAAETVGFDPSDGIDLWYAFIIGLPALVAAVASVYGHYKTSERLNQHQKQANQLLHEVKNDHPSNLRDDITDIANSVKQGFKDTHDDIHQLRSELDVERRERLNLRADLNQERRERIKGDAR